MKKNLKRITILLGILILICCISYMKPTKAAGETTLSASGATVESGKSFTVTITSSKKLSSWTISLGNSGDCTFSSATGGNVNGTTLVGGDGNGATTLAKYTFKAPTVKKDTTYTISFSASAMTDATVSSGDDTVKSTSCSAKITVKATGGSSSGNNSSSGSSGSNTTTTKPKTPKFTDVNKKVYTTGDPTTNLRASCSTSSAATSVNKGTELTLTGTSSEKIEGYTWYRVTYQGATKYVASSLITYTKPKDDDKKDDEKDKEKSSNKNLSSLKIEGIEISPAFDKDVTQYTAHVEGDVTELKIDAKAEHGKAKVSVEGNKGLKEGDNIIKVKVTAEDETTRTYFITVTQGEGTDIDTGLKLSELQIARVDFESTFRPDVHSYDLDLTSYVKKLDITAVPNQEDATVEITGNEDFKEGQNVIVILLTSADGKETANYQIRVNVPAEVIEQAEEPDTTFYILIGIAIAVVLIAIVLVVKRRRAAREDEEFDDDDFFEENTKQEDNQANRMGRRFSSDEDSDQVEEDAEDATTEERRNRRSEVTLDDFLNAPDGDDDTRKPRGGRHSR